MRKKAFLLVGNGSFANRGCEAIVRGTKEILDRAFPESCYLIRSFGEGLEQDARREEDVRISHVLEKNRKLRKLTDIQWWKMKLATGKEAYSVINPFYSSYKLLKNHADCAMQVGGDNYSLDYGFPYRHVQLDKALLRTNKPLVLWGASVGPFDKNLQTERFMTEHLKKFSLILAREKKSIEYLYYLGVRDNVRLVADPAFTMQPKRPRHVSNQFVSWTGQAIAISLGPLLAKFRDESIYSWSHMVFSALRELRKNICLPFVLVPHVTFGHDNDYSFLKDIYNRLGDEGFLLLGEYNAQEYKWFISKCALLITARTHATIASLSSSVPTLSIAYSMKAVGINNEIFGNQNYVLRAHDFSPELVVEKVKYIMNEAKSIRSYLDGKMPAIKEKAYQAAQYMKEIL